MNSYNYSYNVLINRLEAFAAGHLLIKRFTHGQIDLADMDQNEQYPFMHVVPNNIKPVEGGMQFDFQILFADIPRDKETKAEYQREVISDCVRLAQDLIAEVKNGLILFGFDVQLVTPPVIEPFVEEYKNTLTGVSFSLQLEVPWDWSACDIPAVWSVGGTSSGGTGNAYGITLKTNGVNNAVQNILDLVAGTNITITDNGDGSVTFDASGGGGATVLVSTEFNVNHTTATGNQYVVGDRVWYQGNVYACIANNDALLPTNTLYWTLQGAGFRLRQSPVDWNATSGDYQILNKPNIPSAQGLQDVITTDPILTVDNTIDCATFGLTISDTSNFEVNSTSKLNLDVNGTATFGIDTNSVTSQKVTGTIQTQVIVDTTKAAIGATDSSTSNTTQFSLLPNEVRLVTPNVHDSVATVGQVLTLSNAGTGEVEFTTPTTGGGILHGTAAGTDTFTVSIAGVVSYSDGDAFLVRFTNGNTTGCTLNINGIGAIPLYRNNDGALIGGDIWAGAEMLCIYNSTLSVFQCIGTSSNSLFAYVTNAEPSTTITKGQPVYAFGGTGDRLTVKLANNTTDATSAQTVGMVVSTSIAPNQKGIIIVAGQLDNLSTLPTSTFADGDAIYLGATAGSITNVKPYAPNHLVYLGFVTTASPGNAGRMYVRVQNGYELDELHNVVATAPVNNDYMYYDSSTSLYRLRQLTASLITDSTTVGQNLVTLPNPSAVRYLRINADNTVSALTLAQLKTDLSLGSDISVVLGSNVTNVGTGFEDVTGLSFAVTSGKTYKWRATLSYASTATMTVSSNGPTTSLNNARFTTSLAATTNAITNQTVYDAGANAPVSNNGLVTADGIFRVTASGTWTIRFRCSTAAAMTVRAGSVLEYSEVL